MRAVDDASLRSCRGIVGLVGETGCGKTTMGRALIGVMAKSARIAGGRSFQGARLTELRPAERRAMRWRDIAFMPQSAMNSLDPVYRIGDQLIAILTERGGLGRGAARRRSEELFGLIGIEPEAPAGVPASVFRGYAPARGDRDGARAGAEPHRRRRAGDGARRHRAAPDPRRLPQPARQARHLGGAGHARHQRRRLCLRPHGRHVCGTRWSRRGRPKKS